MYCIVYASLSFRNAFCDILHPFLLCCRRLCNMSIWLICVLPLIIRFIQLKNVHCLLSLAQRYYQGCQNYDRWNQCFMVASPCVCAVYHNFHLPMPQPSSREGSCFCVMVWFCIFGLDFKGAHERQNRHQGEARSHRMHQDGHILGLIQNTTSMHIRFFKWLFHKQWVFLLKGKYGI